MASLKQVSGKKGGDGLLRKFIKNKLLNPLRSNDGCGQRSLVLMVPWDSLPVFAWVIRVGQPGRLPGPVERKDPGDRDDPLLHRESPAI
jgi:hypothetical protein